MNPNAQNPNSHNSLNRSGLERASSGLGIDPAASGEDTLRLIANLPAPQGLESRLHAALRFAPRKARVLAWPMRVEAAWVRAAAAAAIVTAVAGGGWGVYSWIQPALQAKSQAPAKVGNASGFSSADAKRSPQTLNPPVVSAAPKPAVANQAQSRKKTRKKAVVSGAQAVPVVPAQK